METPTTDTRRFAPFIWPTWISGTLSGEKRCEWAPWYRSHYKIYERLEIWDEGDRRKANAAHSEMVARRAETLRRDGWIVHVEAENKFKVDGRDRGDGRKSCLSGEPDIVAVKPGIVKVFDEKSGQKRESDVWQVRIYLWALGRTWFRGQAVELSGAVEYRNDVVLVPPLEPPDKAKIGSVLAMCSDDLEPPQTPSYAECKFCDLAACKARMTVEVKTGDASDVF